jgi:NAD(P)H-dependent flavin oxidoreductase YrpB (nitropropane dioxygenase family)
MSFATPICELLEIEFPIVLAGMGEASTPALAAAVSNAGGLGVIGAATAGPKRLQELIDETRRLTDRPFGVDTLLPASVTRSERSAAGSGAPDLAEYSRFAQEFMRQEELPEPDPSDYAALVPVEEGPMIFTKEFFEAQMEVIIEARVPVYAAGLGNPAPWLRRLHEKGTKIMAVVGRVRHAVRVAEEGIDVIVAQGHDAGGHNSPIGTITDGRGIAAAIMLGAQGAWVGTAFLATEEAGIFDFQKQALLDSSESDTTISRSLTGKPARMIRSRWSEAWEQAPIAPLPMPFQSIISAPVMASAVKEKRADILPGFAGQGVGAIREIRPAAEVLQELVAGAEQALSQASSHL